ncbi:MAG: HD domain-containing protein [Planctomycetes bacterium]|nr:HD domain-containing protein [Planctomycetota bacterium]
MMLAVGQEDVCAVIRQALAELTPVNCVRSAGEALKNFLHPSKRPLLAMIDLTLPDGSGLDLADNINSLAPSTHVFLYGAKPTVDELKRALNTGCAGFLSMPFEFAVLQARIAPLLDTKSEPDPQTLIRKLRKNLTEQTGMLYRTRRAGLMALARLAEHRDSDTGMHVERVAAFSVELARLMKQAGLHAEEITNDYLDALGIASALHDIGKVAVADEILRKPGRLSPEEFSQVKQHCHIGWQVVQAARSEQAVSDPVLDMAAQVVRSHHEKWDGSGYPDGLAGLEIPLCARIVGLIDAYDAMRSNRVYNKERSAEATIAELRRCSSLHFDPEIVEVFVPHLDRFENMGRSLDRETARWK